MKTTLISKTFSLGKYDFNQSGRRINEVTIDIKLCRESEIEKKDIDGNTINEYYTLSICGNVWNSRKSDITLGGQCLDTFAKTPILRKNAKFIKLHNWWKKYHLNDLKAGLRVQNEYIANNLKYYSYTDACEALKGANLYEINGCKYGHSWLVEIIPSDVINEIIEFCK